MQSGKAQPVKFIAAVKPVPVSILRRALNFAYRAWRPTVSVLAVTAALWLGWHSFYGKNGLSSWLEKRGEDRELRKEINELNQENARLRERIEQLKSNPDAIRIVAHDQLHYAKPNEVIVTLPPDKQPQPQPAGTGR